MIKKKFSFLKNKLLHFLVLICCFFNLPSFCAFLIKIQLFKPKFIKKNKKIKKTFIVLFRQIGNRDIEIIYKSSNHDKEFFFLRRGIFRVILFYFSSKKKSFFDYFTHLVTDEDFFNQKANDKKKHEKFLINVIFHLKKILSDKNLSFITFNYTYSTEQTLYAVCKKNNLPVILWHKEGVQPDTDAEYHLKKRGIKFRQGLKNFSKISVYNDFTKKNFLKIDKSISKKIVVNGNPRIEDYLLKKKFYKKVKNILFLNFDERRGFPKYRKFINLNWNKSYSESIEILNELSKDKSLNIGVKIKHNSKSKIHEQLDKRIKIFKSGSAEKFINQSDIIIGHNSTSTIEALINGKFVMVPFFENNSKLKKYLLRFNKDILYTSKKNMKKTILNMINKKVFFPINNQKHTKTIKYYFGDTNSKNINRKYLNLLN